MIARLVSGPPGVCNDLRHFLDLSFGAYEILACVVTENGFNLRPKVPNRFLASCCIVSFCESREGSESNVYLSSPVANMLVLVHIIKALFGKYLLSFELRMSSTTRRSSG